MMMIIKKNLRIISQVLNIPKFKLLIKSADTFAFKKKALGIAKNATKAIPISTNSIVPVTGAFKNLRPNTSQKVNTDNSKSINQRQWLSNQIFYSYFKKLSSNI